MKMRSKTLAALLVVKASSFALVPSFLHTPTMSSQTRLQVSKIPAVSLKT